MHVTSKRSSSTNDILSHIKSKFTNYVGNHQCRFHRPDHIGTPRHNGRACLCLRTFEDPQQLSALAPASLPLKSTLSTKQLPRPFPVLSGPVLGLPGRHSRTSGPRRLASLRQSNIQLPIFLSFTQSIVQTRLRPRFYPQLASIFSTVFVTGATWLHSTILKNNGTNAATPGMMSRFWRQGSSSSCSAWVSYPRASG